MTSQTTDIPIERFTDADRATLEQLSNAAGHGAVHDALIALRAMIDAGETSIILTTPTSTVTPAQAAKLLGMSRTHLYKLLDRGMIPSVSVGRDRRIMMRDLRQFEHAREAERAEMAHRIAHSETTTRTVIQEVAAGLRR